MIPYFDAHCDTITAVLESGCALRENGLHVDLNGLRKYSPAAQVFAVWNGRYEEKAALLRAQIGINSDIAVLCRSVEDAEKAALEGRIAAFLSIEGAEQIDCSESRLINARERDGVIMINLCWNHDNALCGAAMDGGGGLTGAGRSFVAMAQSLGVAVDLSHASERTFWDTVELAAKPVIASHSNSAKLYSRFPRNLTDAQFSALMRCGGGAGLNLCPDFLAENAGVDDCVRHIEHFLALGGEKSVFIGADLDGIEAPPRGIRGVGDIGKIYEALLRDNLSEALVRDIFYNNLMNILRKTA